MKSILVASAVLAGLGIGSATAADLAARPYTKAPPMVAIYDWTGFYIGGNVGYSWGRAKTDGAVTGTQNVSVFRTAGPDLISSVNSVLGSVPLTGRANVNGIIGGGQAGYNWQQGRYVYGLEADIQGSDEHGSGSVCALAACFNANYKLDWFGTLRGRVGFLPTDQLLLYATGGLAYGHFASDSALPATWGATKAGWTVGAGGEYAVDRNWSVKLEYLYMDLGDVGGASTSATGATNALNTPTPGFNTVTTTTLNANFNTRFTDHIVRVGLNYKFGGPVVARY
jgi:outer membrane immunogenic protein